ncbi:MULTISPECIES: SpoIIE family protein phosphatase [unclassified Streptomyces]|uniref:SpoIIE family protein phosphatase n=1 Tax=unclassified Streptomyces TaxID=2593676 RepID=UPI002DDAACF5|nr:SpoIIE family protein phosphatase [Streptomyces sp. NBC_01445]WSE10963.1 PAS domain-containing SpoIIE family protein phosphatase/ATP-binding protein [Streptomyces sp. NBC_01445]
MGTSEHSDATEQRSDVADAAPVLLDTHGVVSGWSGGAGRLLGYAAAEVVGRKVAELLLPADAARVPALSERCRRGGGWSGILTARHRDGHSVTLMVRVVEAQLSPGSERWIALVTDLTGAPGWNMSRSVLEQMATRSPLGIAIVDTDLRYVWSNEALEQFGGGPAQDRIGRRLADIQPGLDSERLEEKMREVLETGEAIVSYEQVGRVQSEPHRQVAHAMSFSRLNDDDGHPLGVYYTAMDITDRYLARQRLALLDRAGEHIGRSLNVLQTGQELADVAVPGIADFVAVDLLESVLEGAEPTPGPPSESEMVMLRRAGHRSVRDGVPETVVRIGETVRYHADSPPVRVLTSGESWHEERVGPRAEDWAAAHTGRPATSLMELGLHSMMIVPIRSRGITMGVTSFFRRDRPDPFDADDLALAEEFVARAAICVDNARRYTRERDAALVLQRSLLPSHLPEQNAVDVTACYRPADELTGLGGDWFDVIPLSGARVALVVGDVPGHGIDGAAAMGRLRTAVQTLADLDLPPEEVLAHLDDLVSRGGREEDALSAVQAVGSSCLYVVYDPVSGQCAMASSAHPPPALVTPDGAVSFPDLPVGPALGTGGLPFEAAEFSLAEGTVLALHTDGLLAVDPREPGREPGLDAGRERLRNALELRGPSLEGRCVAVVDALVPARQIDDVALLMARTHRLGAGQVASWDLESDPAVVAEARKKVTRQLSEWGLDELAYTTELVVSELVTNAIRYASGPIRLRLIVERALICEVSDAGASAPHLRHPRTTDEGGRGLFLVSQFSQRWGARYTLDGKIIWAEQSLTDEPDTGTATDAPPPETTR